MRLFAMEMAPTFGPDDLDRRDVYQMAVWTMVNYQPVPPFSAQAVPIAPMDQNRFELLREQRRLETGRPRAEVEALVQERYRRLGVRRLEKEPEPPASHAEEQRATPTCGNRFDFQSGEKDLEPEGRNGGPRG